MVRTNKMNTKDRIRESRELSDWLEDMLSVLTIPESPDQKKVVLGLAPLHLVFGLNRTITDFVDNGLYTAALSLEQPLNKAFMSGSTILTAASEQDHVRLVEKGMMPEFRGKLEKFQNESELDFLGLRKCLSEYLPGEFSQYEDELRNPKLDGKHSRSKILDLLNVSDCTCLAAANVYALSCRNLPIAKKIIKRLELLTNDHKTQSKHLLYLAQELFSLKQF